MLAAQPNNQTAGGLEFQSWRLPSEDDKPNSPVSQKPSEQIDLAIGGPQSSGQRMRQQVKVTAGLNVTDIGH